MEDTIMSKFVFQPLEYSDFYGNCLTGKKNDTMLVSMGTSGQLIIEGCYYVEVILGSIHCLGYTVPQGSKVPVFSGMHRSLIPLTAVPYEHIQQQQDHKYKQNELGYSQDTTTSSTVNAKENKDEDSPNMTIAEGSNVTHPKCCLQCPFEQLTGCRPLSAAALNNIVAKYHLSDEDIDSLGLQEVSLCTVNPSTSFYILYLI